MNYLIAFLFILALVLHLIVAFGGKAPRVDLSSLAHAAFVTAVGLSIVKLP